MKQAGSNSTEGILSRNPAAGLTAAVVMYLLLSIALYEPVLNALKGLDFLIPLCPVFAASGCCLLSRRWLAGFFPQLIAGAVYGFGPYLLSFGAYHPLAGMCAAAVPWLFCPAVLWKPYGSGSLLQRGEKLLFTAIPFVMIFLYFWIPAQSWIGPYSFMPKTQWLTISDLWALAGSYTPGSKIIGGLYPVSVILALMGLFVYLHLLRILVLLPVAAGLLLALWRPLGPVGPMVWLSIPMLFLSILTALGSQAFVSAGFSDRKWILYCLPAAIVLSILTLWRQFPTSRSNWLVHPAGMYVLSALMIALIYFIVRIQWRGHLLRRLLILTTVGINLWIGARQILTVLYH